MLLTFAEIQFLASLGDNDPVLPVLDMLEEPPRSIDDIEAAGLASLVARELCREFLDDEGYVHHVDLDDEIADIHEAIHGAVTSIQVTTVSPERTTFWLLLDGLRRVALTPVGAGVFGAVLVPHEADLRAQVVSLVNSALVDDPCAGVTISRGGRLETMSSTYTVWAPLEVMESVSSNHSPGWPTAFIAVEKSRA